MPFEINRSLRLDEAMYYQEEQPKEMIVLHHTVGGSARSTFNWWQSQPRHIATAYIVDRDGTAFEIFDPKYWAFHLGLRGTGGAHDKRSIGIEIASWGGLVSSGDKRYRNESISPQNEFGGEYHNCNEPWRGFQYFESYAKEQIDSVMNLVNYLLDTNEIPRQTPADHLSFNPELFQFKGIIGHHHVRTAKSDVHPGFDWDGLRQTCLLDRV